MQAWLLLLLMVLGKNTLEKKFPDPKNNPIPNLTLTLTLNPRGGLFPGGIFSWHRCWLVSHSVCHGFTLIS